MAEHEEIIAVLLFFIALFAGLLVVGSANNITGMVVAETEENVQAQVQELINNLNFLKLVDDANMCLMIKMDDTTTYSYDIDKSASGISVSSAAEQSCDGPNNEDFIFTYISYSAFLKHAEGNPSLDDFRATGDGTYFYVLPSKYIEKGMTVKNKAEFESKYDLVFNQFTNIEQTQFLATPTSETYRPTGSSMPMGLIYGGAGLILGIIVLVILAPKLMKKPAVDESIQLITYIKSAISKGYAEDNLKRALVGSGWSKEAVDKAIEQSKSPVKQISEAKPSEQAPKGQAKS